MPGTAKENAMRKVLTIALFAYASMVHADSWSWVVINGQTLTTEQLHDLEMQLGAQIPAGNYLVNWNNGCWANLATGASGCLGQSGGSDSVDVFSRYGSGSRNSNGDWNHYSNAAGMGVGGTGDGCYYTTEGWSNC
jgi:hypothetical protein